MANTDISNLPESDSARQSGGRWQAPPDTGPPGRRRARVLLYCHDTYGLGHLARTLSIARRFSASPVVGAQLVVTGSPVEHRFTLPPDTDTVKLPALVKVADEHYEARSLGADFAVVRALRRELLLSAARAFRPDVVIVDHAPAGVGGEALPALQFLRQASPGTRLVLGLRDVIDEAARVRATWARQGIGRLLDELYDRIVVYGAREVVDVTAEYGFSQRAAAKTRFVGYLGRPAAPVDRTTVLAEAELDTRRLAVVVAGGGGDGERLLGSVIEGVRAARAPRDVGWLIVSGPLMPPEARARLADLASGLRRVRVVDFVTNLGGTLRAADGIVAMAGYNTVCEILSAERPAVLVPRTEPRLEQWIRAARLEQLGLLGMLAPENATPRRLLRSLLATMDAPVTPPPQGMLNGLDTLDLELGTLLPRPTDAVFAR